MKSGIVRCRNNGHRRMPDAECPMPNARRQISGMPDVRVAGIVNARDRKWALNVRYPTSRIMFPIGCIVQYVMHDVITGIGCPISINWHTMPDAGIVY